MSIEGDDVVEDGPKDYEIGAGGIIKQQVYDDPKDIDYWQNEPSGMLYVNYCNEVTKRSILKGEKIGHKEEGFLNGLKSVFD